MKDLTIKFTHSSNKFPNHEQEIRYFDYINGGFDSYGVELVYAQVYYTIDVLEDEDYTGNSYVYTEENLHLLEDSKNYKVSYQNQNGEELPEEFFWIDLNDYFDIFDDKILF